MGDGDHALTVDLDDAVADADPSTLGDATAKQTADLERDKMRDIKFKNFVEKKREPNLIRCIPLSSPHVFIDRGPRGKLPKKEARLLLPPTVRLLM